MDQTPLSKETVGWCHGCGTVQHKSEMPLEYIEWQEDTAPVCLECKAEPWSIGVWDKGEHGPACSWAQAASQRIIDWSPAFACSCYEMSPHSDRIQD